MLGNPMGGGCSGGAWVKSGTNKVVSVNSYSYSNSPDNQYGPLFTEDFEKLLEYTKDQLPLVQGKDLRYFTLHNSGAFVARMKIEWTYGESSGTYEESGYHDICVGQDRTIDIASIDGAIPPGAYVRLKVHVVAGKGKTANEEFIYSPYSIEQASYEIIGTTLHNNLMRI